MIVMDMGAWFRIVDDGAHGSSESERPTRLETNTARRNYINSELLSIYSLSYYLSIVVRSSLIRPYPSSRFDAGGHTGTEVAIDTLDISGPMSLAPVGRYVDVDTSPGISGESIIGMFST